MKKLLLTIATHITFLSSFAQVGSVAPDFTATDINGNVHNLYDYLNAGKTVIIDVSTTWCTPCWMLHHEWQYIEDWYAEFGPDGTDQLVVLFYEMDASTTLADLNGTGPNTQGDWVTGTPYPIFNENPINPVTTAFINGGFPTVSIICPTDKLIKYDLWTYWNSPTTMHDKVVEVISNCSAASVLSPETPIVDLSIYPNPVIGNLVAKFQIEKQTKLTLEIYSIDGQLMKSQIESAEQGFNEFNIDTYELATGAYYLSISDQEENKVFKSFMKN